MTAPLMDEGRSLPGSRAITRVDGMPDGRYYRVEGFDELFPSVTTVLGIINKPGLALWAKNAALESVQKALLDRAGTAGVITPGWVGDVIGEARRKPESNRDQAADFGTQAHELIESILQGEDPEVPPEMTAVVENFFAWRRTSGLDLRFAEMMVYSAKYRYAGAMDAIGYRDGKPVVLDWKTSNGIHPEYALQVAAYSKALEEMTGEPVGEAWVVRLGKSKPEFEARQVADLNNSFTGFRAALSLWRGIRGNLFGSRTGDGR